MKKLPPAEDRAGRCVARRCTRRATSRALLIFKDTDKVSRSFWFDVCEKHYRCAMSIRSLALGYGGGRLDIPIEEMPHFPERPTKKVESKP